MERAGFLTPAEGWVRVDSNLSLRMWVRHQEEAGCPGARRQGWVSEGSVPYTDRNSPLALRGRVQGLTPLQVLGGSSHELRTLGLTLFHQLGESSTIPLSLVF